MSLAVFPHTFVHEPGSARSVAPYIHAYRGKTFVVALAGEAIAAGKLNSLRAGPGHPACHGHQAGAGARLSTAGERTTGGQGPCVALFATASASPTRWRSTARRKPPGQLRFEIEAAFSQGLPNTPMANATVRVVSGNFLTARPVGIVDGVDFMHSGLVRRVDGAAIRRAIDIGALVLLSPFGFSPTGEAFNLTMEDVATSHRHRAAGRQAGVHDRGARRARKPGRPRQRHRHRTGAGRRQAPAGRRCPPQPSPPTPPSTCSTA